MVEDLDLSHRQAGERQEAISKANTYLENLLASLSSGVLAFDSEGRLLRFNESAVGLLGNELHALTDKLPAQWPESSVLSRGLPAWFGKRWRKKHWLSVVCPPERVRH